MVDINMNVNESPFRQQNCGIINPKKKKIIRNAVQCPLCSDIIESTHRHDFVGCNCGNCFVDGGKDYLRFGWTSALPIDLCEFGEEE